MKKLLNFCAALNERHVPYDLKSVRDGAVMVCVAVPGEYWEVEFFADDSLEIERYVSQGVFSAEESDLKKVLESLE